MKLFSLEDYVAYRRARRLGTRIGSANSYAKYLQWKVKGLTDQQIQHKLFAASTRRRID